MKLIRQKVDPKSLDLEDKMLHDLLSNPKRRVAYIKVALAAGDSKEKIKGILNGLGFNV